MEAGTQRITCDHGWWLSPSGQGVWLPAGLPHCADYSEDAVLLRIELPSDGFGELPADCKVFRVSGLLRELMVHALELSVPGRDNQDAGWVLALIADQVRRSPAGLGFYLPAGRDRRLRRVMALLEADPGARLSMEELSALAHCSLRTLLRLFETETGMSFQRWRERLRMIVASDRLARGCSVTETALILGYRSTGSFSTMFFRVLGIRPSQVASKPRHGSM
jgi:AraC-like DNA-binding protein